MIYKISDDKTSIVVEEQSSDRNYEAFLQKLTSSVDHEGNSAPRYALYDVEYDLHDDGRRYFYQPRSPVDECIASPSLTIFRATIVFISWVPEETSTRVSS